MPHDLGRDLHLPDGEASDLAAVVLHPHPGMGGDRHHPLVVAIATGLASAGVASLRIDLRDPDVSLAASQMDALRCTLLDHTGATQLVLVGYSWGAVVAATASATSLRARVLIAPPVATADLAAPPDGAPALVLVPAHDQFGPPDVAQQTFASWPDTEVEVVEGCDHFLAGAIQRIADRAVGWVTGLSG